MIKETNNHMLNDVYQIWKRANRKRKYAYKKTFEEFKHHFFENPSSDNKCFFAEKNEQDIGALMVESYNWGSYLHDWIYERDNDILQSNFQEVISNFEKDQRMYLYPVFGYSEFIEDYINMGFKKDERAPYHLLMKKDLKDIDDVCVEDLKIDVLKKPNPNEKIEKLSELILKISSRLENIEDIKDEINWELEENLKYYLLRENDEILAYSGIEQRELFTGKDMYWIKELGVHPENRREGIATTMLQNVFKRLKNDSGDSVFIDAHSKNPAKKLYKKLGFQIIEKFPNLFF
ncbi:MAG: GNAT family N-acetyltransferase [Thermoplasmata archaeon]